MVVRSLSADLTADSLEELRRSKSVEAVDFINGIAVMKINTAMMIDATGSNPCQPNILVRTVETTTPTEPKVSARMCKNIPLILSFMPSSQSEFEATS